MTSPREAQVLHQRFCHANSADVAAMTNCTGTSSLPFCTVCAMTKSTAATKTSTRRAKPTAPLMCVSLDLIGSLHGAAISPEGYTTAAVFLDLYSSFGYVVPLRGKDEAVDALRKFKAFAEAASGRRLMQLISDSETVLKDGAVKAFCLEHSIDQTFSPPHHHEYNPVERYIRTIKTRTLSALVNAGAPAQYFCWALLQAVYATNRLATSTTGRQTPESLLANRPRPFGATTLRATFCQSVLRTRGGDGAH